MFLLVARRVGRLAAAVFLAVLYVIGVLAAVAVLAGVTCAAAVRLGWSDIRKRASHGAA